MRGATSVTLQPHQIPRLPHRMTRMLDRRHIWNVIYNARSSRCHHPTSPNTAPATQNDSHAWSSSHMKRHLQCAEQRVSPSNLTKYCACHTEWLACLIVVTYETSFTMRGATGVTIQPHQILRLPRRKTHILSPHHIWNLIYNARSNRCHPQTSPNTAPATKNNTARFQRKSPKTGETSFPMRGRSENDPTMIRPWKRKPQPASPPRLYFSSSPRAFAIEKYNVSRPILHSNLHHILRLPRKVTLALHEARKVTLALHQVLHLPQKVTLELHQILRLPQKVTRIVHPHDIWNLIYNARSNRCHPQTSPNTAPATKNNTARFQRKSPKTGETSFPMRGRSEHDPRMIREWKRKPQPASQVRLLFELPRSIFYCKIQRFEPNLTFKHSPSAAPATKSNTWPSPNTAPTTKSNTWTSPNTAPTTKSNTWPSPSTAPATKSDIWTSPTLLLYSTWRLTTVLDSTLLDYYSTWLYSTWLYSTWLYSTWFCSTLLDSTLLDTILLDSTLLDSTLLDTTLLDSTLLDTTLLDTTLLDSTLLDSTLLDTTLLDTTLLDSTLLDTTLLDTTLLDLLYLTLLYLTLFYLTLLYLTLLYLALLYLTLLLLDSTLLDSTLLDTILLDTTLLDTTLLDSTTLLDTTLLDSTLLDSTLLDYSTWLYSTWLYSTWHYSTWHYSTWLYSTWHYSTWLYSTWHYSTWHYSTWLYSTWPTLWLYSTWLDSTWLYSTWHYSTWPTLLDSTLLDYSYSTWHYSTWLYSDLTLLGCRSYIGSFSSKLPLIRCNLHVFRMNHAGFLWVILLMGNILQKQDG